MGTASDKARFYLEQTVPELRKLERKGVFSKEEITSIVKKRSDFEHKLNTRAASSPSDYARYAEYEFNLESLTQKRAKRLGAKISGHKGQQRIFFILERGTRKFYADTSLWMQYIEYARKQRAYKKLERIYTDVLRLHPTKPQLWISAARFAMDENADMQAARGHMQRGLRFCKKCRSLWVEYAKLEMIYIAKIAARRQVLGLGGGKKKEVQEEEQNTMSLAEDVDENLPEETALDEEALQDLANTPAMTGAIPMAIFDAAMIEFQQDSTLAEEFFDMIAEFDQISTLQSILQHILNFLETSAPQSTAYATSAAKIVLVGAEPHSPEFPVALGQSLQLFKEASTATSAPGPVAERAIRWLLRVLRHEDLDIAVRKVVTASIRQYSQVLAQADSSNAQEPGSVIAKLIAQLRTDGRKGDAINLTQIKFRLWPDKSNGADV